MLLALIALEILIGRQRGYFVDLGGYLFKYKIYFYYTMDES